MKKSKIVSLLLATVLGASMVLGGCGSAGNSDASNNTADTTSTSDTSNTSDTSDTSEKSKGKITLFQQKTEIYDQLKEMAAAYEEGVRRRAQASLNCGNAR